MFGNSVFVNFISSASQIVMADIVALTVLIAFFHSQGGQVVAVVLEQNKRGEGGRVERDFEAIVHVHVIVRCFRTTC